VSRYKIGQKLKVAHIDRFSEAEVSGVVKVGDTGMAVELDKEGPGSVVIKLDKPRTTVSFVSGMDDQFVPITKPPLLDRIRRWFIKPSIDLTPGFKWEDMGWHPKDFIPDEEKETEKE
jgi:hypothetical protein